MEFNKNILDLGCGDGKQVYRLAKKNPQNFYIGIDSNEKSFEEVRKKSLKKASRGGLKNLQFIVASAENLPNDLDNFFDEIQINFPWGTLLSGVIIGNNEIMEEVIRVGKKNANLKIITTYDNKFEEKFKTERELPELTLNYIDHSLKEIYKKHNIEIVNFRILSDAEKNLIDSPWGKKILQKREREVYEINAKLNK